MDKFASKILHVDGTSTAAMLAPASIGGTLSEQQLEDWIVAFPDLTGEPLLILGRQLAEFVEDKDRLDVLAVDRRGEIVLIELKATESFKTTDLQALGYVAGYAARTSDHFAEVLRKHLAKSAGGGVTGTEEATGIDDARARIVAFLDDVVDFDSWKPTDRVRIKLIAPEFPKRILNLVRYLEDVYGMPIEAIQVQRFPTSDGAFNLTFERLLPLKSETEFDLHVRALAAEKRSSEVTRNPAILPALLGAGVLTEGQTLWFSPRGMPQDEQHRFDSENVAFKVTLRLVNGGPMFGWKATAASEEQLLRPSLAWFDILAVVLPGRYTNKTASSVFNNYTVEPGGPALDAIARNHGVW